MTQVAINEVGDRLQDHEVFIYQNGQFIPVMFYRAVDEWMEITYSNHGNGVWHGLIWAGGATEVWMCVEFLGPCY